MHHLAIDQNLLMRLLHQHHHHHHHLQMCQVDDTQNLQNCLDLAFQRHPVQQAVKDCLNHRHQNHHCDHFVKHYLQRHQNHRRHQVTKKLKMFRYL